MTRWSQNSVGASSREAWSYLFMLINVFPIWDYQMLLDVYYYTDYLRFASLAPKPIVLTLKIFPELYSK